MRIRKIMRGAFYTNGLQTDFEAGNLTPTSIDTDWYVYYTDENNDAWKIAPTGTTYETTTPVLVDSTTTSITVTPAGITGYTGSTWQLAAVNQDSVNVISECTFASDSIRATVSASGLITIVQSSAGLPIVITTTHNDGPTGTTELYSYTYPVTSVVVTPVGFTGTTTGTTQQLTVVNQDGLDIIEECTFESGDTDVFTVNATGLVTVVGNPGNSFITATHTLTGEYARPTGDWAVIIP